MDGNSLAKIRIKRNLSQNDIAEKLGYTVQSISLWENDKSFPGLPVWSKYASILQIDLYGLLFQKEQCENHFCDELTFNIQSFATNLRYLRKRKGLKQIDVANCLCTSTKTIISYEKGYSTPNKTQFISLCNLYKMDVDHLYFALQDKPITKSKNKKVINSILIPVFIVIATSTGAGVTIGIRNSIKAKNSIVDSSDIEDSIVDSSDIEDSSNNNHNESSSYINPTGKYIYYGYYPQTVVDDINLIETLDGIDIKNQYNYVSYKDDFYLSLCAQEYKDYSLSVGKCPETFANNEVIEGNKDYWFKVEPVKWKVLNETENDYLLMSDICLETHIFDEKSNNYKESDIRQYLISDFYNQLFFLESEVDNSLESTVYEVNDNICENTIDKIYLPSNKELQDLSNDTITNNNALYSDYLAAKRIILHKYVITAYYWTRSPDFESTKAVCCEMSGLFGDPYYINPSSNVGIRPMIKIKK